MSNSPSPKTNLVELRSFPFAIFLLVALFGLVACGGGTGSFHQVSGGGGGGGGGGNGTPCAQPNTIPGSAGNVTAGVGTVTPSNFMDLHVGSSDLISGVTIPYGSLRLWDTSTGWAQINTANGSYDFSNLDGFVSAAQAENVDLLYNLGRTPTWASSNQSDNSCSYDTSGQGGPGQCDPPADLNSDGTGTDQDWINWVSAVATQNHNSYGDTIKYFEIWNEWNIPLFWTGTPAQLVRMEQDARCVFEGPPAGKSCTANGSVFPSGTGIDPAAKIVSPSPVGAATDLNEVSLQLTTYFNTPVGGNNGGTFADMIGFHGYVSTSSSSGLCPIPENVTTVVTDLNNVLPSSEVDKPWFDTEDSWGKAPDEGFTDPDRQAAFLARDFLLQRSLGVARVYWYRWDATQTYGGALWTSSNGITEAGDAWSEVSKWINGATLSSACTAKGSVWTCGFTRTNPSGYQALAVWDAGQDCLNEVCTTSGYTVPSGYTQYLDLTDTLTTTSTGSTIQIGAKPILLENGSIQ